MRAGSPLSWGSPPFWILTLSEANLPPLFESHPNWCLQILWNTLKWWCYILYYTKSIESVIIITLYTFRLNSVFTTDSLVRYCLQCFFYLICKRNEHETFLITILLNLMCDLELYINIYLIMQNQKKEETYQLGKHTKCLTIGSI